MTPAKTTNAAKVFTSDVAADVGVRRGSPRLVGASARDGARFVAPSRAALAALFVVDGGSATKRVTFDAHDATATTMIVYKPVYTEESSPEKPKPINPKQIVQDSTSLDVLGLGYWVEDASTPAPSPGDWQIGDIIMISRQRLDVNASTPSVLEDGDAGIAALERTKSTAAAGDWANIRFVSSDDIADIALPQI
jgi:hypothetical protein